MTRLQWLERLLDHFPTQNIILLNTQYCFSWCVREPDDLFHVQHIRSYDLKPISEIALWLKGDRTYCYFGVEGVQEPFELQAHSTHTYSNKTITWYCPPV
jgi:hypothetical protein